jgi:5-hydroxyisourate hydrolase-like protein (transthyretin family)
LRRLKIAIIVAAALVVTASLCGSIDLAMSNSSGNNVSHSTGDAASGSEVVYAAASADNSSQLVPTTLTLTTSDTNPAVNQTFTLSGTLTANGTPVSGSHITLMSQWPPGTWNTLGTVTTLADGSYSFNRSEASSGAYAYQVSFNGDTQYASSSNGRTVDVGNLNDSAINISTTNSNPAVNQTFTLYGVLTDGVSGTPLAGQPVSLVVQDPSGQFVNAATTTSANGSYSFTRSEASQGTYFYEVWFLGTSTYFQSEAMIGALPVGNPISTTLSVTASNTTPAVGQPFTFSGSLTDVNGTPLSGRTIDLEAQYPDGNSTAWQSLGQTTTDANGHFNVTYTEQTSGEYWYEFWFYGGDGTYATTSAGAYIAVGTLEPTSVSLNSSVTNPAVGQSFTLSGYLTDANGTPLAGQEIALSRSVDGQYSIPATRFTDQNGYYSFNWNENTSGSYVYAATYNGDQNHTLSVGTVEITVGSPTPTQLSLTASNSNPAVNQTFTLSGTLKSNGTPLSGSHITLMSQWPPGTWNNLGTATTGTNGSYSFTVSEASPGHYGYQTDFPGDNTYAISYAGSGADVGS